MFDRFEMIRMAQAMGRHASQRQGIVARNIANADTPGYRARDLERFEDSYRRQDRTQALRVSDPRHLTTPDWAAVTRSVTTDSGMSPNGNSVSLEDEMLKAAELKREHELSLGIYRSALNLMRTSIGRRG